MKKYHPYNAGKSDDWFHNYETEFKQEYNSENPFVKKIENKSYAQAARQAPNRKTNKQSKYQNKYVNVENTYNNRNRSSSTSRRNNFQNQQNRRNRFKQGNRNNNPTYNFRQNQQQRSQRYEQSNSYYKRIDENTESQNINRNTYQRNHNLKERFFRTRREKPRHSVEPTKCEIPRLINLSNLTLSAQEIQILSKGLKFTPTPQTSNYNEVKDDISNFCRKLRLTEELFDKENRDESIVRNKSTYKSSKACIHLLRKVLTDKEFDYLTNFKCKSSNFYGLPKIHKSNFIREPCKNSTSVCVNIPHTNDLKLRPIVAGPSCETHRLSNFLDILLKPILKHVPSFVRDDLDLLNHLPRTVSKDSIMVSFDVVNLYTTIPHKYGLKAIEFWLEKFPSEVPDRIEKKFIIEGIKFILQNNYYNFNGESYRQISGTTMRTNVAPT
ncbi:unnamed protein product [Mytilus coruscus]|uniref:Reverse transcriptase domain-containing protein n=1 Tax=Mytilus coruscus TaxID=42192 RepID=A0A6J8DXM0_MYTCO|nr:unnamed protein product [Mytilus coruscus]